MTWITGFSTPNSSKKTRNFSSSQAWSLYGRTLREVLRPSSAPSRGHQALQQLTRVETARTRLQGASSTGLATTSTGDSTRGRTAGVDHEASDRRSLQQWKQPPSPSQIGQGGQPTQTGWCRRLGRRGG
ncbi:hypothetical protein N658DRAFT_316715 [Parathielavia hyrcaniae]|uniref:Uncharacterized protein n=1 Tax=Parathielavia hyrcaniae TaxID=113614 RepID=A0AAN6SXZ6_9PEZI|nr:hypothetical protein N658DRAFT_316715 [Parathielavia hyrcaniae]